MFKAFDSAPTSMNSSEMYTALQTKVVDAQRREPGVDHLAVQAERSAEVLLDDQSHVDGLVPPRTVGMGACRCRCEIAANT
jgi:hypothetical protein